MTSPTTKETSLSQFLLGPRILSSDTTTAWLAGAGLGLVGLIVNLYPLSMAFGLDILAGGYFAVLAVRLFGLGPGTLAGAVSAFATYFLWHHPYAAMVFTLEIIAIGLLVNGRRWPATFCAALFWLLIAPPLLFFTYHYLMNAPLNAVLLVIAKQATNGLLQVVAAEMTLICIRFLIKNKKYYAYRISISELQLNALVLFATLPVVGIIVVSSQAAFERFEDSMSERLAASAKMVNSFVVSRYGEIAAHAARYFTEPHPEFLTEPDLARFSGFLDPVLTKVRVSHGGQVIWTWQRDTYVKTESIKLLADQNIYLADGRFVKIEFWINRSLVQQELTRFVQHRDAEVSLFKSGTTFVQVLEDAFQNKFSIHSMGDYPEQFHLIPQLSDQNIMSKWEKSLCGTIISLSAFEGVSILYTKKAIEAVRYMQMEQKRDFIILALFLCLAPIAAFFTVRLTTRDFQEITRRLGEQSSKKINSELDPDLNLHLVETQGLYKTIVQYSQSLHEQRLVNIKLNQRLNALANSSGAIVVARKVSGSNIGDISYVSPSIKKVLGYEPHEAMKPDWFTKNLLPKDRIAYQEMSLDAFQDDHNALEFRIKDHQGVYRTMIGDAILVRDQTGNPTEVIGIWLDRTEERAAQLTVIQNAKLAEMGELATGLAHELNQPLNVIGLASANMKRRLERADLDVDWVRGKIDRIEAQINRASTIINHMRIFGRSDENDTYDFPVNDALEPLNDLLGRVLKHKNIHLSVKTTADDVFVRGHPSRLEQALMNMIMNAKDKILEKHKANPERSHDTGTSLIGVETRVDHESGYLEIRVFDDGGGIDPGIMDNIFKPFFTTKPSGKGTGLGLPICHNIIADMNGGIEVENGPMGAVFTIKLPLVRQNTDSNKTDREHENA